ncbi:MAG: hypothetical protein HXY25_02800 [Alphaproteobacteria bacterium]|nr:hypothetical protein [Alphaproteobacteria bacterium]
MTRPTGPAPDAQPQPDIEVFASLGYGLKMGTLHLPRVLVVTLPGLVIYGAATAWFMKLYFSYASGIVMPTETGGQPVFPPFDPMIAVAYGVMLLAAIPFSVALSRAYLDPGRVLPSFGLGATEFRMLCALLLMLALVFLIGLVVLAGGLGLGLLAQAGLPEFVPILVMIAAGLFAYWFLLVFVYRYMLFMFDIVARERWAFGEAFRLSKGQGWRLFGLFWLHVVATIVVWIPVDILAGTVIGFEFTPGEMPTFPPEGATALDLAAVAGIYVIGLYIIYGIMYGSLAHAYKTLRPRIDPPPVPGVRAA